MKTRVLCAFYLLILASCSTKDYAPEWAGKYRGSFRMEMNHYTPLPFFQGGHSQDKSIKVFELEIRSKAKNKVTAFFEIKGIKYPKVVVDSDVSEDRIKIDYVGNLYSKRILLDDTYNLSLLKELSYGVNLELRKSDPSYSKITGNVEIRYMDSTDPTFPTETSYAFELAQHGLKKIE